MLLFDGSFEGGGATALPLLPLPTMEAQPPPPAEVPVVEAPASEQVVEMPSPTEPSQEPETPEAAAPTPEPTPETPADATAGLTLEKARQVSDILETFKGQNVPELPEQDQKQLREKTMRELLASLGMDEVQIAEYVALVQAQTSEQRAEQLAKMTKLKNSLKKRLKDLAAATPELGALGVLAYAEGIENMLVFLLTGKEMAFGLEDYREFREKGDKDKFLVDKDSMTEVCTPPTVALEILEASLIEMLPGDADKIRNKEDQDEFQTEKDGKKEFDAAKYKAWLTETYMRMMYERQTRVLEILGKQLLDRGMKKVVAKEDSELKTKEINPKEVEPEKLVISAEAVEELLRIAKMAEVRKK